MFKKIATDIFGILLIVASILLGWLPGPGGLPLLLAGLGLLSLNHEWARRWLKKAEVRGMSLSKKLFREHPLWQLFLDMIGLLLLITGIWLFTSVTHNLLYAGAAFLICIGLVLLLGNRKRLQHLLKFFKRRTV